MAIDTVSALLENNLLQRLGNLPAHGELAQARTRRDAATRHTQGSYRALFEDIGDSEFGLDVRLQVAAHVAHLNADPQLREHYWQQLHPEPSTASHTPPAVTAALAYAQRVTLLPASATPEHLQALLEAGWTAPAIVSLAQVVAYVNFESRLLTGLRLLAGQQPPPVHKPVAAAGAWNRNAETHGGRPSPIVFTQDELGWEPWLPPREAGSFSSQERQLLEGFGQFDSDYFRLLAHNLPVLEQRTLTDRGIFFTPDGLPRAERELAAAVTSKVNGCIFCASVHARKASHLSKRHNEVEALLAVAPNSDLAVGEEPRWHALIDFSAALAVTPARPTLEHLGKLRALHFSTLAMLDLVQSVAFFSWANRLMLTLGEPLLLPITKP